MPNWKDFKGAGSEQIHQVWVVPKQAKQTLGFFFPAPPAFRLGYQSWNEYFSLPSQHTVRLYDKQSAVVPPSSPEVNSAVHDSEHAWNTIGFPIVGTPANIDVCTAHLLAFGW
jgi:hypothetical protein